MSNNFDTRNLNEKVYYYLLNKIISNELKPGERILYDQLTKEVGVSKTPLRDAINRLQQDGLVEIRSRSGTYVNVPDEKYIADIYEVRKALECQAIKLSIERLPPTTINSLLKKVNEADEPMENGEMQAFFDIDQLLHQTIIENSNNHKLIEFMKSLEILIKWIGVILVKDITGPRTANEHHKKILSAMLQGDVFQAQAAMEEHIDFVKEAAISNFGEFLL